jgi:ubiquinone/menaquinone biosynthesis C-methylase UbiE
MRIDYSTVTELAGEEISQEQLERLCHRYYWAGTYSKSKDVIEAACGTGPGIGFLSGMAESFSAGDYTPGILDIAKKHYGDRIELRQFDAQEMPIEDHSKDVVILFEAIYYLPDTDKFVKECKRVLRLGGRVLIATANKDLYDFNPSPFSHNYLNPPELKDLFERHGFSIECFGYLSVDDVSLAQKMLRPIKKVAVGLNIVPKTMAFKKFLKRFVFGELIPMPAEITEGMVAYAPPTPISIDISDNSHKVLYCVATLE